MARRAFLIEFVADVPAATTTADVAMAFDLHADHIVPPSLITDLKGEGGCLVREISPDADPATLDVLYDEVP